MTTPDHTHHDAQRDEPRDRSREDWWTAFTAWLRDDPARSGPDGQVHRGPDGRIYYGCCVPPGAVRIDPADGRALSEPSWDRAADHTTAHAHDNGDGDGDDSGDGW